MAVSATAPQSVQVMTMEVCFLFDMLVADSATNAAIKHAVRHVMESKTILKLTHGCGRLSAVLRYQLSSGLHSIFDTQVSTSSRPFAHILFC